VTEAETMTAAKRRAALRGADYVRDGMLVGLGSGSTAELVIAELGRRVAAGLRFQGVPSSNRTRDLAARLGIPLVDLDHVDRVGLVIDGADEVDGHFNLIKGHGGALVREKLLAESAERVVIVVDDTKLVDTLGRSPVPVEVVPFGWRQTLQRIATTGATPDLRTIDGAPFVSDNGNYILDCKVATLPDPAALEQAIRAIPGVVDTGLFLGMADTVLIQQGDTVQVRQRS
jgi:ribose 5-phosphate isomerase A